MSQVVWHTNPYLTGEKTSDDPNAPKPLSPEELAALKRAMNRFSHDPEMIMLADGKHYWEGEFDVLVPDDYDACTARCGNILHQNGLKHQVGFYRCNANGVMEQIPHLTEDEYKAKYCKFEHGHWIYAPPPPSKEAIDKYEKAMEADRLAQEKIDKRAARAPQPLPNQPSPPPRPSLLQRICCCLF